MSGWTLAISQEVHPGGGQNLPSWFYAQKTKRRSDIVAERQWGSIGLPQRALRLKSRRRVSHEEAVQM